MFWFIFLPTLISQNFINLSNTTNQLSLDSILQEFTLVASIWVRIFMRIGQFLDCDQVHKHSCNYRVTFLLLVICGNLEKLKSASFYSNFQPCFKHLKLIIMVCCLLVISENNFHFGSFVLLQINYHFITIKEHKFYSNNK